MPKKTKIAPKTALGATRHSLPISLLRTRELIMEDLRPVLSRHKVTEQQWRVLRVIAESNVDMDTGGVADKACLHAPSLTRIAKALIERSFIRSYRDPKDRRRTFITLTDEGANFIDKVVPETVPLFAQMRDIVGTDRWENLVQLLAEIRDDINKNRKNSG